AGVSGPAGEDAAELAREAGDATLSWIPSAEVADAGGAGAAGRAAPGALRPQGGEGAARSARGRVNAGWTAAGDPGVPEVQGRARVSRRGGRAGLSRLPPPVRGARRHSDHAHRRGETPLTARSARRRRQARRGVASLTLHLREWYLPASSPAVPSPS